MASKDRFISLKSIDLFLFHLNLSLLVYSNYKWFQLKPHDFIFFSLLLLIHPQIHFKYLHKLYLFTSLEIMKEKKTFF